VPQRASLPSRPSFPLHPYDALMDPSPSVHIEYPATRQGTDADWYHGELVADPYRWLENTDDPETRAWIKAQNELTDSFLSAIPAREELRARLTELWDYPKMGAPFERGGTWFQLRNTGLQDQPVVHVMDRPGEAGRVLLDPNQLSPDGTVAVTGLGVTEDGKLAAYATSQAGSDWMTWRVRDVASGEDLADVVEWSKFSGASWLPDRSGFYYSAPDPPEPGKEYLSESRHLRVRLHRLGTPQEADELFYEAPDEPEWLPSAEVTPDGRFVVLTISRGTFPEHQVHVLDREDPGSGLVGVAPGFDCQAEVVANVGRTFYLLTDEGAERRRVVSVVLDRPRDWREVVPESSHTLVGVHHCGGRLVCHYLQHARSALEVCDLEGRRLGAIDLPGIVSVVAIAGRPRSDLLHFSLTSFTESGSVWSHDLASGETALLHPSTARVDPTRLVTEQVRARSADGTEVPMFLTHRTDVVPNGDVPTLLWGYGGYNIPVTPSFSVTWAAWVERGGLLAVANLRGGGEYGRAWYEAGRLEHKQNVFDDFCACARHLEASGWSRAGRIAMNGGSNGGLLVGACLTQHPELFGAAVPEVGVLDLLRFHRFTIGWAWTSDFGNPDDPDQYRFIRSWSPLHNVVPGRSYPPTLIMTGDHDDRVVPGHSLKFAAALQAAHGGEAPVLLRVETSAGHGAGKPTSKSIAERADFLAFLEWAVGG